MKAETIKLQTIILLLFAVSIFGQTVKINILETTDSHGAIFPYNFKKNKPADHSLAQIYSFVEESRKDTSADFLLFSNGDILQGTPAVYYYNFEKPEVKHLYARVMNFMGYDLASVGNHDIETGHAVYDKFKKEINFPWLAANAIDVKTGKSYFPPYSIIYRGKIKIAVLGMITPAIPNWLPEKIWNGIEFEDMIETAKKWVPIILEKENPDLIIGLFHSGVDYTYGGNTAETYRNENASQLVAEKVDGFDIVFVGHDHHGWNKFVTSPSGKKVLLMGGTSSARQAALAKVILTYDSLSGKWNKSFAGQMINSVNYRPDEDFMRKFKPEFDEVKKYVSQPLGEITKTISTRESLFGDSEFIDFVHKVQLQITGADISFAAPISFDTKIDSGKIFVGTMFNLYKYENFLYTMKLSGGEIKGVLEYGASLWFENAGNKNGDLLRFIKDDDGNLIYSKRTDSPELADRYYNFLTAAGIKYTVDLSKAAGDRINIISMTNGEKFYLDKEYLVAVNSYRGNGGGGHLTKGAKIPKSELASRVVNSTEKDLRFYIMKWIEKEKKVAPHCDYNWKILPDEWAEKAAERDYELMFGKPD